MPSDALTVAVTTGLGVSVIAGILTGICYILTQGLPKTRNRNPPKPWHCSVCGGQFRSIQGVLEVEKVVTCAKCKEKVCRVRCSRRDPQRGWVCQVCLQPETWFKGLLKAIHLNNSWYRTKMDSEVIDELDEDLLELRKKEREQVRDFIERLVESMLGGNLDDVSIRRIYNDRKYLPITGQSPCSAHAILKQLIKRFLSEAVELPELKRREDHPALPQENQTDRTYEDLLSTAIINKVVQTSQNGSIRSSSNSACSKTSTRKADSKEYFFGEDTLDTKWKNNDSPAHEDTSSLSSYEEFVKSDSSIGSSKYIDRVSLTIKQRIEEGTSSEDETLETTPQKNILLQPDDTWNENWYLQKRRTAGSNSPVPVPMLVPNPSTEAKVLIGDKEAEDTSDLSDVGSDFGDPEVVPDIKNILVNSRTIIGGKNVIKDVREEVAVENAIVNGEVAQENNSNVQDIKQSENTHFTESPEIVGAKNEEATLLSLDSNTEQDTEYTEQYASLPRTVLQSPKPAPRTSLVADPTSYENELHDNLLQTEEGNLPPNEQNDKTSSDEEEEEKLKMFKGTYSEREKEKWKHSVNMPNNPYTPENLERRLSNRSTDESLGPVFGRDYYIKEASRSAGARQKKDDNPFLFEVNSDGSGVNGKNATEETSLVTALPALVQTEENQSFETSSERSIVSPRPNMLEISSDSDLSIERIYNLESGRVIQNNRQMSQEIPTRNSGSPEGIKYIQKEFDQELYSHQNNTDENHNTNTIHHKKREFLRSLTQTDDDHLSTFENVDMSKEVIYVPYSIMNQTPKKQIIHESDRLLTESVNINENTNDNDKVPCSNTEEVVLKVETFAKFNDVIKTDQSEVEDCESRTENKYFGDVKKIVDNKVTNYSEDETQSESKEFSLEYSTGMAETDDISRPESSLDTDPEILDLKEKRVVKDLLGKFSQSYPNLSSVSPKKSEEDVKSCEVLNENEVMDNNEVPQSPSVKALKKIFDKDQHAKQNTKVYSLTARSIPLKVRHELKEPEEKPIHIEVPQINGTDEDEENEEEDPESLMDITKSRIAFYENLEKRK